MPLRSKASSPSASPSPTPAAAPKARGSRTPEPPALAVLADGPAGNGAACPWVDLDEAGTGLSVDNFLTTWMSRLGNALRRTITVPYAAQFGVTVTEWRMLSVIAHEGRLPFSALVVLSSTDKALVSRTLKLLEARGLVLLQASGRGRASKLICRLSPAGLDLHDRMIRVARERQAAMILRLSPDERLGLYRALTKLKAECERDDDSDLSLAQE
ncbi:MAG: MarR family transcriptional regulator [Curvibacter sp.]|nr:MAG: MarR family transcriptional regulator [Curvibacter sp.]